MWQAGGLPKNRSTTLSEAEALKAAIAELDYAITKLIAELRALQQSDGIKMMDAAGATEADWQCFLEQQHKALEMELARIVSNILAERTEA